MLYRPVASLYYSAMLIWVSAARGVIELRPDFGLINSFVFDRQKALKAATEIKMKLSDRIRLVFGNIG
jgi:hypothetical protein